MTETWTILKLLQWTTDYFSHRGIESARLDAELILSFVLDLSRVQLYAQFDRPLNPDELKKVKDLVKRRALREPLAYLRKAKEFYSLDFMVSPAVLIPRPETELLVEEGIKAVTSVECLVSRKEDAISTSHQTPDTKHCILDIGTGSGCIAVTLAKHLPASQIWAADVSSEALEIAAVNVKKQGVDDRVRLVPWDLLKEPWKGPPDSFHLIVSNPPYVPTDELPQLAPELSFEPNLALEAGREGLDFYPPLIEFARSHLHPGGWLLLEMGVFQGEKLLAMCEERGFKNVETLQDLSGKPRVLKAQYL